MTNDQNPIPKECPNPKPQIRLLKVGHWGFLGLWALVVGTRLFVNVPVLFQRKIIARAVGGALAEDDVVEHFDF